MTRRPVEEKFWELVEKGEHWVWKGYMQEELPMVAGPNGRMRSARKISWQLAKGCLPPGYLYPGCGEPRCVRPEHLQVQDFTARDREIRRRWALHLEHVMHVTTFEELGREFGMSRQRVEQIVKGNK